MIYMFIDAVRRRHHSRWPTTVVAAARGSDVGPQGRVRVVPMHEGRARPTQKLGWM